jgi:hypothetical protein
MRSHLLVRRLQVLPVVWETGQQAPARHAPNLFMYRAITFAVVIVVQVLPVVWAWRG